MIYIVLLIVLFTVSSTWGQAQLTCEEQLAVVQKQLIVVKSSREQTESSMATVWSRLEKSESELAKLKSPQKE